MPTYLITNRAPESYAGSTDAMTAWNAWFDRLADNLVDRGNPVFARSIVGNCGPDTELGGYTLITADNLDAALALASGCPMISETAEAAIRSSELTQLRSPSFGKSP